MKGKLPPYKRSFFSSPTRKDGLQLDMYYEDGIVYSDFHVDNRFEGYANVVHGGMTFGVLDSMLWAAIFMETKKIAMTRKVEMEFFKPIVCNTHYRAVAKVLGVKGRDVNITAWVEDDAGEVYATVKGVFREAKGEINYRVFMDRFEFDRTPPDIRGHFLSLVDKE